MPVKALLFDLDGTMLNTDPIHQKVFADVLAPHGIDADEDFYTSNIHGRLNADIFAEFLPDHPDHFSLSELKEAEFRRRLPRPYPETPGLSALINRAEVAGWAIGVVTNAPRLNAEAMLEAIEKEGRPGAIIIGEECERGKPHPEPYLAAMEALGATPQTSLVFEDSPSGVRAAKAAGARCIGIRSTLDDAALRAAGADLTIDTFNDPALEPILDAFQGETA
ncbi:HAD family hydrolase [Pseudoroseicyclus tamaricis]|uniref:HAD family phosphatase n=1 Tax=Pseudoroseicyclus tamaricis TaxID=2705421 RepID=A0A6B2JHB8_9RHOB|nr:HAD family phosphatase [Pseudoroseicyclus tamaricis]NDV00671.1 HAD family phosphatase [Pseudoroseicyclus tamaricis]